MVVAPRFDFRADETMNRTNTSKFRFAGTTFLLLCIATTSFATLEQARAALVEWSRVTTLISRERSEWMREKNMLADTLAAAKTEVSLLEEKIDSLNALSTEADRQRVEISSQIETAKEASASLAESATVGEMEIRNLVPLLPETLRAELHPLLQRLPENSDATKLPVSQRIQTLVGLLTQIEKFNSNINVVSEIKEVADGTSVEVKTLYFGLAAAFFSDASGFNAGYGFPTHNGWQWKAAEGNTAARIANAIAISENAAEPAFVTLPIEIN